MDQYPSEKKDTVFIEMLLGERHGPYMATLVSSGGYTYASIFRPTLEVEDFCSLILQHPNGTEEVYFIVEVRHNRGSGDTPPHWILQMVNEESPVLKIPGGLSSVDDSTVKCLDWVRATRSK